MLAASVRANRAFLVFGLIAGMALAAVTLMALHEVARRFGAMGVLHILSGIDHLAFLVMLMIVARDVRMLLLVITTFTLAHSITLTAAALGWVVFSPTVVEPLIAFTILYVAIENLVTARPRGRLLLTFGFGLIHGLGFASALTGGPLPPAQELLALFSFNIGVETGQVLFLAAVFPLWGWVQQRTCAHCARRLVAIVVALLCVYWLWERL